jgi:hypothetical protein
VHTPNQLIVSVGPGQGWRFPAAGRSVVAGSVPASYLEIPVRGLSQHWGGSIHRPHDEVVSALLAGVCPLVGGSGNCDSCEDGGPGTSTCGVDCGGTDSCSAECGSGFHGCCNCSGMCSCCPDQESAPVKK